MPVFTDKSGEETVIKHPDGNITKGHIRWTDDGPILTLEDGRVIREELGYIYRVQKKIVIDNLGKSVEVPLGEEIELEFKPYHNSTRPYAKGMAQTDVMIWPPPKGELQGRSGGWYGRMVQGEDPTNYFLQRMCEFEDSWLTIISDNMSLESHPIAPYETPALTMDDDLLAYKKMIDYLPDLSEDRTKILAILDTPPPDFAKLASITEKTPGIYPKLGLTMRQSLNSIIPMNFEDSVREDIMVFIAWMLTNSLPHGDPVELFESLISVPTAKALLEIHYVREAIGLPPLDYINILHTKIGYTRGIYERDSLVRQIVTAYPLDMINKQMVDIIKYLNAGQSIPNGLPITKEQAVESQQKWNTRALLYWNGVRLELIPKLDTIGLREVVFHGSAHQWPHTHLAWSGLLPDIGDIKRFSSMIMPVEAAERTTRRSGSAIINHYIRADNWDLYDTERSRWTLESRLTAAVNGQRSYDKFCSDFKLKKPSRVQMITPDEGKALDLSQSPGIYLDKFESPQRAYRFGSTTNLHKTLNGLLSKNLCEIRYTITTQFFLGLYTRLSGEASRVLSTTSGILKHTPFSSVRIADNGQLAFIVSRLPQYLVDQYTSTLLGGLDSNDLIVEISRLQAMRSYRSNLFQRLGKIDGGWVDDIDKWLIQGRTD